MTRAAVVLIMLGLVACISGDDSASCTDDSCPLLGETEQVQTLRTATATPIPKELDASMYEIVITNAGAKPLTQCIWSLATDCLSTVTVGDSNAYCRSLCPSSACYPSVVYAVACGIRDPDGFCDCITRGTLTYTTVGVGCAGIGRCSCPGDVPTKRTNWGTCQYLTGQP